MSVCACVRVSVCVSVPLLTFKSIFMKAATKVTPTQNALIITS